ncbi:MAG: HAD hydrolase-like protein [Prevotella sp.]
MTTQEIIIQLLKEKGMTKAELAKKVGMAQPNVSRLLNGKSQIRQSTLEKIRIALDVDMEELKRFQFAEDDASPIGRLVVGYIDYKGKVIRCNDFNELKKNVIALEQEITAIEREREKIARKNKANKKVVDVSSSPNFSEIDLKSVKTIDCSKQRVWSFRKSEDKIEEEGEIIENRLGNMAAGSPFKVAIDNDEYAFSNSEALYICGMFSDNTAEHNEIQKALFEEKSGYSAKKNVRRKNENKKRADWNEFNVEWMKWVILQKVQGSAAFRDLLLKIPSNAIIVENSTFQQKKENDTSAFWGARNEELKSATRIVENYIDFTHPYEKKVVTGRLKMKARNELQYIGKYVGVNCMGGILKMAQLYLLNGTPMPIDYDLLNSKYIHLFGHLLQFKRQKKTDYKMAIFDFDGTLFDTSVCHGLHNFEEKRKLISQYRMFEGVEAAINGLKAKGVQIAVITDNSTKTVKDTFKYFGLPELDSKLVKGWKYPIGNVSKEQLFEEVLKESNLQPHQVISFGNQSRDIEASNNCKIDAVACNWFWEGTQEELEGCNAQTIINNPIQILDLF